MFWSPRCLSLRLILSLLTFRLTANHKRIWFLSVTLTPDVSDVDFRVDDGLQLRILWVSLSGDVYFWVLRQFEISHILKCMRAKTQISEKKSCQNQCASVILIFGASRNSQGWTQMCKNTWFWWFRENCVPSSAWSECRTRGEPSTWFPRERLVEQVHSEWPRISSITPRIYTLPNLRISSNNLIFTHFFTKLTSTFVDAFHCYSNH